MYTFLTIYFLFFVFMQTNVIAAAILGVSLIASTAILTSKPVAIKPLTPPGTITVTTEGKVKAVPDVVVLTVNASLRNQPTKEQAMSGANTAMNSLKKILAEASVEEKNIKTTSLSVQQDYIYENNTSVENGFYTSQTATIRLEKKDTKVVDSIIDKIATLPNMSIDTIHYEMLNQEAVYSQARAKAFENLKAKVNEMTQATGVRVGKIQSISEYISSPVIPGPAPYMTMADSGEVSNTQTHLSEGENEYSVNMNVVYEIQ